MYKHGLWYGAHNSVIKRLWCINMVYGMEPNNSVIKRLWCIMDLFKF